MTARDPGQPYVAALYVYPLKSAQGIRVDALDLDWRGARHDRRWALVGIDGVALTQRVAKGLARIRPQLAADDIILHADGRESITVPRPTAHAGALARVWESDVPVDDAGDPAAAWCSEVVGVDCRLVRIADSARRPLQPRFAGSLPADGRDVALTDGAPLLVLGQGSVDALNTRLATRGEAPIPAERFRPNILLGGTGPHAEDEWGRARIGGVELAFGSPCARCVMTTIDQATLAQGVEPLREFAGYRRLGGGVVFGINTTHAAPGTVSTGAAVEVLEPRAPDQARAG